MEYHVYWLLKSSCFELSGARNTVFFELKNWCKDNNYWLLESACLKLFGGGKYDLFWTKKLMEWWDLLIKETFLFWIFRRWEIRSFLEPKSWCKDDIYRLLKISCFELFGDWKYGLFLSQKSWWKDDIYLVFLSFPWYSRTWEIWFFLQWQKQLLRGILQKYQFDKKKPFLKCSFSGRKVVKLLKKYIWRSWFFITF